MATILTSPNPEKMTSGERRVLERLKALLEDDCRVWFDIPVGRKRRYPDFIILHPSKGLLFLEVKDWRLSAIRKIGQSSITLQTDGGTEKKLQHLLKQARDCTYGVINHCLSKDRELTQRTGEHQGKLLFPYAWGVAFTNITRIQIKNMERTLPDNKRECVGIVLPDHLVIYKDEINKNIDAETFQKRLWGMFPYQFGTKLTQHQIDHICWHLFPEIRIPEQRKLFEDDENALHETIKVMDIRQEQLARNLGGRHRVIHGVSGSGKTLILGYRCVQLARFVKEKPILVLCYNIVLATKLRSLISTENISDQVIVHHFHDWCGEQLKTYHVDLLPSDKEYWERQVETVIHAVDEGMIPRAQYSAVMIDEGHDFEADWLKLVVQMVEPENDLLLLLYDDAQSIYKSRAGLKFSLSSVGIKARGRTSILRVNYRNTYEIIDFAYTFLRNYIDPLSADDDHIPIIEPEIVNRPSGRPYPRIRKRLSFDDEIDYTLNCLEKWHQDGIAWGDVAILYTLKWQGGEIFDKLQDANIPSIWLGNKQYKLAFNPNENEVNILTIHSSKGLEFPRVIIVGVGHMDDDENSARVLYVGMTRAQHHLLITSSEENDFTRFLIKASQIQH